MSKTCTDHLGNEFRSLKDMCGKYGLKTNLYCNRIKMGWTVEKALTAPIGKSPRKGSRCCDHEGRYFPSISAMARHWGVSVKAVHIRLRKGWPLKDALTLGPKESPLKSRKQPTSFFCPVPEPLSEDTPLLRDALEQMWKTHDADALLEAYRMCLAKNPSEWEQGRINEIYSDNLARLDWEIYDRERHC